MSYLRRQGNQNSCFINFWHSKFLKSTILGILSTLKSPDYYSEYVFNITRKSNKNFGHQNNMVTLTVCNCMCSLQSWCLCPIAFPTPCRLCECMVVCLVPTKMRMGSGYLSG